LRSRKANANCNIRGLDEATSVCFTTVQKSLVAERQTYNALIEDAQMLMHLERGDTLFFEDLWREWRAIERQVERLGFGERYVVAERKSKKSGTKVYPLEPAY